MRNINSSSFYLTGALVREYFKYNENGTITRIKTKQKRFLGHTPTCLSRGYIVTYLAGRLNFVHRIVWVYFNESIPIDMDIDHINGIKSDNRIENLRLAHPWQNGQNYRNHNKNNRNKSLGVTFNKARGKFIAQISIKDKHISKGFDSLEEAQSYYLKLKRQYHEYCTI